MVGTALIFLIGEEGVGLGLFVAASLAMVYFGREFGSES